MLVVGLTGGIGSGKSIISKVFELLGIPVYNSDEMAKYLISNSTIIKEKLKINFGKGVFNKNDILNRKLLAEIVFNDTKKLNKLNSIVHPEVRKNFNIWSKSKHQFPYILKEAAILIETETYKELDKLILVTASEATRIKRVMLRDEVLALEVKNRMRNQLSDTVKMKYADFIIKNDDGEMILEQIVRIHNRLKKNRSPLK